MSNNQTKFDKLRSSGNILSILLKDRTTERNIIWATDSYIAHGAGFSPNDSIKFATITGPHESLIQPRLLKSEKERVHRTRERGEVFTPLWIVQKINNEVGSSTQDYFINKDNWTKYVSELRLEIACGEAPFIVSRYDPTSQFYNVLKPYDRVGFLDQKLKLVSKYCEDEQEWIFWAIQAFKASYGFDLQGDNILIARENLLYSLNDFYQHKFKKLPTVELQEETANIISWNIFQMDGLRYVVPMSCKDKIIDSPIPLIEDKYSSSVQQCPGCQYGIDDKHNGVYVKIMDWSQNKIRRFLDLRNTTLL